MNLIPARALLPMALLLPIALLLTSCATSSSVAQGSSQHIAVSQRVNELLSRYAANDQDGVLAMLDPSQFTVFGSDVTELVRTPVQMRKLMADDFALWHSASFGSAQDFDLRVDGTLATAFFHVPFSAGGRPPVLVRFSTTWRKVGGAWLLTQSANTVPTVGSSAAELTQRK